MSNARFSYQLVAQSGMRCNPVGDAVEVVTPFTFHDGNGIELFAQARGPHIHFFDDGFTMAHLHSSGMQLGTDKRRWQPLRSIATANNTTLSNDGVFEIICPMEKATTGFARMVSTLLGVAAWERENLGVGMDASNFVDEVAMYLYLWKRETPVPGPTVRGFSGRTLTFDFELGSQYIDAILPHSQTTGAELRKLIDYTSMTRNKDVLVVVEDRKFPEKASQEMEIIGRVASTWGVTSLLAAVGGGGNQVPS